MSIQALEVLRSRTTKPSVRSRGIARRLLWTTLTLFASAVLFIRLAGIRHRVQTFARFAEIHSQERLRFNEIRQSQESAAIAASAASRDYQRWADEDEAEGDLPAAQANRQQSLKWDATASRRRRNAQHSRNLAAHHAELEAGYRDATRRPWIKPPSDWSDPPTLQSP